MDGSLPALPLGVGVSLSGMDRLWGGETIGMVGGNSVVVAVPRRTAGGVARGHAARTNAIG